MPDPGGWLIGLASFVRRTIRSLGGRTRADRDFEDEVRFHLEMEAASHRAGGVDAGEAERRAARAFGSVLRAREESHDARRVGPLENFGRDLALGLRALRRSPGVTFAAVISLGLGIAASTTMFSIANGILRDLPVREPDRLAHVAGVNRRTGVATLGLTDYQLGHLRQSARSFTAVGGFGNDEFNLGDETRWAERWHGAWVDPAVFEVLGAAPVTGRTFTDGDQQPGAPKVVLLGDRLWRQRYEAARGISSAWAA